jgi:hypothetical protein
MGCPGQVFHFAGTSGQACVTIRQVSFHPETVLFPNPGVNPHACVRGVDIYASVQALDFLILGKNCSFAIRKLHRVLRSFRMDTS